MEPVLAEGDADPDGRNKNRSQEDVPDEASIREGVIIIAKSDIGIYASVDKNATIGVLKAGKATIASGPCRTFEGVVLVPISPKGAVPLSAVRLHREGDTDGAIDSPVKDNSRRTNDTIVAEDVNPGVSLACCFCCFQAVEKTPISEPSLCTCVYTCCCCTLFGQLPKRLGDPACVCCAMDFCMDLEAAKRDDEPHEEDIGREDVVVFDAAMFESFVCCFCRCCGCSATTNWILCRVMSKCCCCMCRYRTLCGPFFDLQFISREIERDTGDGAETNEKYNQWSSR